MFDERDTDDEEFKGEYEAVQPYAAEPTPDPKSPRGSFSMPPPSSPLPGSPRFVTVEPSGTPKSPKAKIYDYPANVSRTPSGSREHPRSSSLSMARTTSGGPSQPKSSTSSASMARTSSGSVIYTTLMMARTPSGGGSHPKSPSVSRGILASPPTLICDVPSCRRRQIPTGARYFHCGKCAEAGYDVCEPCYDQLKRCPGRSSGYHGPMDPRIAGVPY